jgi:hypothetical protein
MVSFLKMKIYLLFLSVEKAYIAVDLET